MPLVSHSSAPPSEDNNLQQDLDKGSVADSLLSNRHRNQDTFTRNSYPGDRRWVWRKAPVEIAQNSIRKALS